MTLAIADQPPALANEPEDSRSSNAQFTIVGIGASAGGLEAFTQLLKALPADTGMAFVLVQHLAPTHPSALAEILSRATRMKLTEIGDMSTVEPNHVYVIPPDRVLVIAAGVLQLLPREGHGIPRPVDQFFLSLAADQRHQAIGVILSGTATDGTRGLEAIKAEGGITFAQDGSAQFDGMPKSAIASGCVDFVLPPDQIAREITRISQHSYSIPQPVALVEDDKSDLTEVIRILRDATGVDFTHYKFNTLFRRVTRRMVFQKIDVLTKYAEYLHQTPAEVDALYQDILISVTSFFRDPASFETLQKTVFPHLLENRSRHDPVRLWILGCSTGQEAYSLAMAFTEAAEAAGSSVPFQLFATDLNPLGIDKARAGTYPLNIAQDVSPERLQRFFTEVEGGYRICKSIRDACVFSRHNVLVDPPFSRIDLISCRNLLIYLEPVLQQRIMPTLHYALKPEGCLWLGGSETVGGFLNLFDAQDSKHKIYIKKPSTNSERGHFQVQDGGVSRRAFMPAQVRPIAVTDLPRDADRVLLARFAPPSVLVSAELDILQYRGDTGPFLTPAPGKASLNLLKMLREGLLVGVRGAILRAGKEETTVREEGLRVKSNGQYLDVAIEVIPIQGIAPKERGYLVLFEGRHYATPGDLPLAFHPELERETTDKENARMAQELAATREYLQSVIEQQDVANEELQSANEEVQSANEELQSTNEELETSKEEIQSSNEELATVNDELNNRVVESNRVNNDLVNLISSVQMAIIILGPDLRVRRFTPLAEKLLNLIPADVGRPLADIKLNLENLPDLESLLAQVRDTAIPQEHEVRDKSGRWVALRVRPYKTVDNQIDGVVVMLVDIDDMRRAHDLARESDAQYHAMFEATSVGMCETDPQTGRLLRVNDEFARIVGYSQAQLAEKTFHELTYPDDQNQAAAGFSRLILREVAFLELEKRLVRQDGLIVWVHVTVNLVHDAGTGPLRAVALTLDITERKRAEAASRESEDRYRTLFELGPVAVYSCDKEGVIQEFNRRATELWGRTPELGDTDERFYGSLKLLRPDGSWMPHDRTPVADVLSGKTAEVIDAEVIIERPDTSCVTVVVNIRPLKNQQGEITGMINCFYDVSERKVAEAALNTSEVRYRRLFETAKDGILILDAASQKITHVNPFLMNLLDYPTEYFLGKELWEIGFLRDKQASRAAMQHLDEEGVIRYESLPLKDCNGGLHPVEMVANVYQEGPQRVIQCNIRDISERSRLESLLRGQASELSDLHRRKDEFLAMLSHELRSPLAPIANAVQLLSLQRGNETRIQQQARGIIERQLGQLQHLVDDLLEVSRITSGRVQLLRDRVAVSGIVNGAIETVRPLVEQHRHELTLSLPAESIWLYADAARLEQVLVNLLTNAAKFTEEGGHIWVTVQREGEECLIRVRDSGVGITAALLPHIFDLFTQAERTLDRSQGGLGIGLALVQRLTELHGGKVEAFSEFGQGTEFVVRLPVMAGDMPRSESTTLIPAPPAARPLRVLVVDDNADTLLSFSMLLRAAGHDVQTAHDGPAGVQAALEYLPDVALLDIGLPGLNGFDVARRIRQEPALQNITLIALTGYGQEADRLTSEQAGFNHHLVKPADFAQLQQILSTVAN
ncbi:MAG: Protein-glutamate methylesterase [Planctomycetaceae bacterium]|nr:Protein-glutamate methylesterase [Planctomycetaceae bacterium]